MPDSIKFFIPTDLLQGLFFIIIFGQVVLAYALIHKNARKSNWDANWKNNTKDDPTDDLNMGHGSIMELSEIVATKSEKYAEALPNIVLILGLLGTFIGITIALTSAADAMKNTGAEQLVKIDNLNAMMIKLRSMMDGMGAQFKTSIYGIIAFLVLSFLLNWKGKKKERIRWCAIICNSIIAERRNAKHDYETKLLEGVTNLHDCLRDTLQDGFIKQQKAFKEQQKALVEGFNSQQDRFASLIDYSKELADGMGSLAKMTGKQVEKIGKSAEEMGMSSKMLSVSADSLRNSVNDFTPSVMKMLESIQNSFIESVANTNKTMETAGKAIQFSVAGMSSEIKGTLETMTETNNKFDRNINESLEILNKSCNALEISNSSSKGIMQKLNDSIEEKLDELNRANNAIQQALEGFGEKIAKEISFEMENISGDTKDRMDAVKNIAERINSIENALQTTSDSICGAIDNLTHVIESSSTGPEV